MKHLPRTVPLLVLIPLVFGIIFFLSYTHMSNVEPETVPVNSISPLTYTIPVKIQASVYETMNALASSSKTFSFKGKMYPELGFFTEEINGTKNIRGFYWTLYVNGMYSNKGASSQMVYPGDIIDWKYEKL